MNQIYLHSTPEGIKLIKGDKMPVMKYWPEGTPMYSDYEKAIERAIASGVPVADIEKAKDLIEKLRIDLGADAKVWDSYMGKNGAIYGPFSLRYEIKKEWRQDKTNEYVPYTVEVAILYDDTPENPEGDFTKLIKLINSYEAGMSEYFRMHDYRNMYGLWEQLIKKANGIKIGR